MNRRIGHAVSLTLLIGAAWMMAAAPRDTQSSQDLRVPRLRSRLLALHPEHPMGYFELAEEIAAEFDHTEGIRFAMQLFILSGELDVASGQLRARLEPSVLLALASIAADPLERRRLRRAAGLDDGHDGLPGAHDAAAALAAYRAADPAGVRSHLGRPGAETALRAAARLVPEFRPLLDRMTSVEPCPLCRNRLLYKPLSTGADIPLEICPTCRGNPGPGLSDEQTLATLRVEDLLVSPPHRRWSSQLVLDAGAPISEDFSDGLALRYGVDPQRPYWRPRPDGETPFDGAWSERPFEADGPER